MGAWPGSCSSGPRELAHHISWSKRFQAVRLHFAALLLRLVGSTRPPVVEARRDESRRLFPFLCFFLLNMPISGIPAGVYHIDVVQDRRVFLSHSLNSIGYHTAL